MDRGKVAASRIPVWPVALALLLAAPIMAAALASPATPAGPLQLTAPALAGWTGPEPGAGDWRPSFSGAAGEFRAVYRQVGNPGATVEVFHAVYTGKPRRGHTLITFGNEVYDPAVSHILASASRNPVFANGRSVAAGELRLAGERGPRLVWYWYCVDHRCTSSRTLTKLLQAWDVMRGKAPRSTVWALSAPIANGNEDRVRAQMLAFARLLPAAGTSAEAALQSASQVSP